MEYFKKRNCKVSDHALDYIMYEPASDEEIEIIFTKRLENKELTQKEILQFKTAFMLFVSEEYHKNDWVYNLLWCEKG